MIALAAAGATEGLWLRAEQQLGGRGRQGRAWASPPGNLYASTLVRLRRDDPPASGLALVAGVALAEAIAAIIPDPDLLSLKWPNDLMLGGAKAAGILLERAGDAVVAGFGVNIADHPLGLDRPVTSLSAMGVAIEPGDLCARLAAGVAAWLARWRSEGLEPVRKAWLARAHPPGTPLTLHDGANQPLSGTFAGLGGDGALILRLADGQSRVIHAGDVFLI